MRRRSGTRCAAPRAMDMCPLSSSTGHQCRPEWARATNGHAPKTRPLESTDRERSSACARICKTADTARGSRSTKDKRRGRRAMKRAGRRPRLQHCHATYSALFSVTSVLDRQRPNVNKDHTRHSSRLRLRRAERAPSQPINPRERRPLPAASADPPEPPTCVARVVVPILLSGERAERRPSSTPTRKADA
jgi:hypothetical protein